MLMILWFGGMKGMQAFRNEVFPDAVPPEIRTFISYSIANQSNAATSEEQVLFFMKSSLLINGSIAASLIVFQGFLHFLLSDQ